MASLGMLLLAVLPVTQVPASAERSVLVLPLEPKGGLSRDLADQATAALADAASHLPGYRITTMREVESTLSQEQLRQVAGCDTVSCAAEIAGALNTDEIVLGSLGNFGDVHVLTLTRVEARSARVLGRALEKVDARSVHLLLDRMPAVVATLFGQAAPAAVPPVVQSPVAPVPGPAPAPPGVVKKPWEQPGSSRPAVPGALAGGVATLILALGGDLVGSIIAVVPVVGVLGLALGGCATLGVAPLAGWVLGTWLGGKRVALVKVLAVAAVAELAFFLPRLLWVGVLGGAAAVVAGLGARLILTGNWITPGSYFNPTLLLPFLGYGAILAGWGALGVLGVLTNAAATTGVLALLGRGKRFWEGGITMDLFSEPSPRQSWLEFKVNETTAQEGEE